MRHHHRTGYESVGVDEGQHIAQGVAYGADKACRILVPGVACFRRAARNSLILLNCTEYCETRTREIVKCVFQPFSFRCRCRFRSLPSAERGPTGQAGPAGPQGVAGPRARLVRKDRRVLKDRWVKGRAWTSRSRWPGGITRSCGPAGGCWSARPGGGSGSPGPAGPKGEVGVQGPPGAPGGGAAGLGSSWSPRNDRGEGRSGTTRPSGRDRFAGKAEGRGLRACQEW